MDTLHLKVTQNIKDEKMLNSTHKSWEEVAERVILYTDSYLDFEGGYKPGGRQRHMRDLAMVVREWGRDVLVVQKGTHDFENTCPDGIPIIGIKSNLSAKGDFGFARASRRVAKRGDVWLYASGENAWPYFAKNSKAVQHGVWWDGPQKLTTRLIQRQRALGMMRGTKSVLCVDTNFINWLRGLGSEGYELSQKCHYVSNYADIDKVLTTKRTSGEPLSLVIARRFEHKRGILIFVDALACLKHMGIDFTAQICTVGGKDLISERLFFHGLQGVVSIAEESMDSVLHVYEKHHIAVVPTLWSEGTSLACIEAIAAGLPVVVSPVGGLGNLVIPGFNGLIINPEPQEIAAAIAEIWTGGAWQHMHRNCLAMRDAFSIDQWRQRVLAWLKT